MYLIRIIRADYPPISINFRVATVRLSAERPGAAKDVISLGPVWQAKLKKRLSKRQWEAVCRKDWGPTQGFNSIRMLRYNVVAYGGNVYRILEERWVGKQLWGRIETVSYWNPPADLDRYLQLVTFQKRSGEFAPIGDVDLDNVRLPLIAKKDCWLLLVDGIKTYCEKV